DVADRPDHAASEPVVHAALTGGDQTRRTEFVAGEALAAERREHLVPSAGCVAAAEMRRRPRVEAAFAEESTRALGFGRQQLAAEVLRCGGVGRVQPAAPTGLRGGAAVLVVQGVAGAPGQPLDRLGEADVIHLAQEG